MTAGPQNDAERLTEAAAWFARTRDEAAPLEDWAGLTGWLEADGRNAQAFARIEAAWQAMDELQPRRAASPWMSRRAAMAGGLLAASVAAAVAVAPQLAPQPQAVVYTAPLGAARTFNLADGSVVRLSAGSRMSVTLRRDRRDVALQDAEALFDVAHDARRPFVVAAGDLNISVVGTRFGVRARGQDLRVSVARGLVEVENAAGGRRLRLGPGQRVARGADGGLSVSAADPGADYGWTTRRRVYEHATLGEAAADLSRDTGAPIRLADAALARRPFTGVVQLDADTPTLVRRLSAFAGVEMRSEAGGYVLAAP